MTTFLIIFLFVQIVVLVSQFILNTSCAKRTLVSENLESRKKGNLDELGAPKGKEPKKYSVIDITGDLSDKEDKDETTVKSKRKIRQESDIVVLHDLTGDSSGNPESRNRESEEESGHSDYARVKAEHENLRQEYLILMKDIKKRRGLGKRILSKSGPYSTSLIRNNFAQREVSTSALILKCKQVRKDLSTLNEKLVQMDKDRLKRLNLFSLLTSPFSNCDTDADSRPGPSSRPDPGPSSFSS